MNTISAIALDRLQTDNDLIRRQNEALRLQLADALRYQADLEAALLSAPLYRTDSRTSADRYYEEAKARWSTLHRAALDRAANRFISEGARMKAAIVGKMRIWHQRLGNLIARQKVGDTEIRIPTAQEILETFMMDLARI